MFYVICLIAVPVLVSVGLCARSGGRINPRELAALIAATVLIAAPGVWLARRYKASSTEVQHGRITEHGRRRISCCHGHTHRTCWGTGKRRTCTTHTTYEHPISGDTEWYANTSNGEVAFDSGCRRNDEPAPERWDRIRLGEPTAIPHEYENYIRANPEPVLHPRGIATRFAGRLPTHPAVYDGFRIRQVINQGLPLGADEEDRLNAELAEINADLGPTKHVSIIIVLTRESDPLFLEALREAWIGGEKNEFIIVVAMPSYPQIAWSGVISWTRQESLKSRVRDEINALGTFDGMRILALVRDEVRQGYIRRPMKDFEYLHDTTVPPIWSLLVLWVVGVGTNLLLARWFWRQNPFGTGWALPPAQHANRPETQTSTL